MRILKPVSPSVSPASLRALVQDTVWRASHDLDDPTGCALVLGELARMRADVLAAVGYRAMREFDDWLFANLTRRRLRQLHLGGRATVELPAGVEQAVVPARARWLLRNALDLVAAQARADGTPALQLMAADVLLDAAITRLGGVPSWGAVIGLLERRASCRDETAGVPESEMRLQ